MSDGGWIAMEDFMANLRLTAALEGRVETWLRQHWLCKPGPQIIHKWDRTVRGECSRCNSSVNFTAELLD